MNARREWTEERAGRRSGAASTVVVAALGGALLAWLFDPQLGRRRRAVLRDHVSSRLRRLRGARRAAGRDLSNRLQGLSSALERRRMQRSVSDDVLRARVRAQLGRTISYPAAIVVESAAGALTLSGPILERDRSALVARVADVPGVQLVIDHLEGHNSSEAIPALQGRPRSHGRPAIPRWATPATWLATGAIGLTLARRKWLRSVRA